MNLTDIIYKTNNSVIRLAVTALLLLLAIPLFAEEEADTAFIFKFFVGRNQFYSPGLDNGEEIRKMYECVDRYKDVLTSRDMIVYVDGYSNCKKTPTQNLAIAKIRSNRVKSELITNKGLKEHNFSTRNHAGQGDFVTVRFSIPKKFVQPIPEVVTEEVVKEEEEPAPEVRENVPLEIIETPEETVDTVVAQQVPTVDSPINDKPQWEDSDFALKTNLLDYAILMPNVELEWKCAPRWSVALEGQMAWYGRENPHKVYRIATVIPEARYWVIERSKWHGMYVGAFIGGALYDLSRGGNGHEGEGIMGGVSAGYMWPISKHLSLDAGLGVGYLRLRDKKYRPLDGHFLYQLTKNINYFGPLRLKLSLVWRIPK